MIIWPGLRRGVSAMQRLLNSSYFYAPRTTSITQTRGAGTPTETRATVATVLGYAADAVLADGQTLLTVASGELRFQGARRVSEGVWSNVDADGAPIPAATLKGAVVEAAAENLCLQSNAFTTTWNNSAIVPVLDTIGIDGAISAWTVTDDNAGTAESITQSITLTAAAYTSSLFIKKTAGATKFPVIQLFTGTVFGFATCDTNNGVATAWTSNGYGTTLAGCSARCSSFNADFWRFELTATATAAAYTLVLYPTATTNATQSSGTVDATLTGSAVFTCVQVELGSYATTYQATTTAAVTRDADVPDDQVASNLTAAAGSVAFTWTPSHDPSGTIALCGSYVDASNYTVLLHDATKYIWRKRIAGVNYDAELTAAFTNVTSAKIAMTWGASGINLAVDGTLGTAHANTDDAQLGTRWQWGADGNGGQQAGAAFKEMYLTPRTMSDAELQAITV